MGVELKNVSFYEFLKFPNEEFEYYHQLGMLMKPDPDYLEHIMSWPYGKVKELQMFFQEPITFKVIPEILALAYSTPERKRIIDEFIAMKWHQVFRHYNHVVKEIEFIFEKEKVLAYEPDADQVEAGIERINKFGMVATIDTLAGGDLLKWDEIENIEYSRVFTKLLLEMERKEYVEKLTKLKSRRK